MPVFSRLVNNSPVKGCQLKQAKAKLQAKPIYHQQGYTDITWWWKTISWLFRSEPTLTDRAVMLAVDAATLIRDAVKELFNRMESFFIEIKDAAVRYANVIVTLIVSFVRQFKKSFNQTVEFFREAFKVTGDKDGSAAVDELHRSHEATRKAKAYAAAKRSDPYGKRKDKSYKYQAQGGDEDDDSCDFYIFKFLTTFVTKLIAFFDMLPKLEFSLSKLNASLTLLGHADRFDLLGKSKWLLNVIYSAITGKELFEDVTMASTFSRTVESLNARLSTLEEMRNPTLDALIDLRKDEKEMTRCYSYLIAAFPKRANNYTTIYNHVVKRCAVFAGSVQGMQGRIKPVTLIMRGPAGCGKTTVERALQKDIMCVISKLLEGSTDDDARVFAEHAARPASFCRNCVEGTPDFDDGYCNPMFYVLGEYLTLKDKTISVEWAAKLIRYADSDPLLLNFAFGAKGTKYFDSPFVIATGNFSRHVVPFNDPVALFRRLDFDLTVRSTAGKEKFDMRKHVVFKMSTANISVRRNHYVNYAFERFKDVYPKTAPRIDQEFGYDQLVMLMVFCYLERIAPENRSTKVFSHADEIAQIYDPSVVLDKMRVARLGSATFFGSEQVFVKDVRVPQKPEVVIADASEDEESSVVGLEEVVSSHEESDSDDDDLEGFVVQSAKNPKRLSRRFSKPHALVVHFVDFLHICEIPIASAYLSAIQMYLQGVVRQLKLFFKPDFKYTETYLSCTVNPYGA